MTLSTKQQQIIFVVYFHSTFFTLAVRLKREKRYRGTKQEQTIKTSNTRPILLLDIMIVLTSKIDHCILLTQVMYINGTKPGAL